MARTQNKTLLTLDDKRIGFEGRAADDDHMSVKVWLRLLSCSTQIEREIRELLRLRFGTTLPRFDYLAQLQRHPEGLRMSALSHYLMVSGGNVTGLTDQLVHEGWVQRLADPKDRRALFVQLTTAGKAQFELMAREHEAWVMQMFSGCNAQFKTTLYEMLGQLRMQLNKKQLLNKEQA
jgi:DNA-binding MarR family transcriptional regulator